MSSSVGLPTIGVNSLEAVAKSNAVAVAYVDAIVVGGSGLSDQLCRGRGRGYIYIYVQLIKSNRVDLKVALYCELTSTLGKRSVSEYPPGARNVWFWRRQTDRQDSYVSEMIGASTLCHISNYTLPTLWTDQNNNMLRIIRGGFPRILCVYVWPQLVPLLVATPTNASLKQIDS